MLNSNDLANRVYKFKEHSDEFVKDSITFDMAYDMCKKFINENSDKSTALKSVEEARIDAMRLIDIFVNNLNKSVDGYEDKERLRKDLKDEVVDYKAITDLINDTRVNEIRINGIDRIFYEDNKGTHRWPKKFQNTEELDKVIHKLLGEGKRLSISTPFINGRSLEGFRVNATDKSISPIKDYTAVIRKFKKAEEKLQLTDLLEFGSLSDNMANLLRILPKARMSFLTVGSTGSGKTVTNEIIVSGIPPLDRQVYIENPCELTPAVYDENGNIVNDFIQLEAIEKKDPSVNDPTPNNLVENALRQTPIWIVLGEVRSDEEFKVLLKAAQTGHNVITTYHAEDAADAIRRYLQAYMSAASSTPAEVVIDDICNAFRFIIVVKKLSDNSRRIVSITEITGAEGLKPVLNEIYRFEIEHVTEDGKIVGRHKRVGKLSQKTIKRMRESGIPDIKYHIYTTDPGIDEEETYNGRGL